MLQRLIPALATFFVIVASLPAAEKSGFLDRTLKGPDGALAKYVVFVPHDYDPKKKSPVILFLHGSGESGTDGQNQTQVGLGKAIRDFKKGVTGDEEESGKDVKKENAKDLPR
jgi:poly(3-hydroxybutyrate) depolymerase